MRVAALALALIGCINSPTARLVPIPAQEPDSMGWINVANRIHHADGWIAGRITQLEEDWTYDDPCGLVKIAMHQCDGTVSYQLHVENALHDRWLWTFARAYGTFGLWKGEVAVFVWQHRPIERLQECKQHVGMGGYCNYDLLDVLTSDYDVLPIVDSARVDSLFRQAR